MESLGKPRRTVHREAGHDSPCHARAVLESQAHSPQRRPLLAILRYVSRFDELPSKGSRQAPSTFQEHGRHPVHATTPHWHVMPVVVGSEAAKPKGSFLGM
jgi:hypothetical protein